ncbi:hypothetical protein MGN70_000219 [Eutypa lata]|nr:hypothetical protein MGN70_000219 [Eutypa lata]
MSKAFNRVVTGWINSSPLTKKSDNGDNQQDSNEMQRGVKRKAKVDPYDPMGDEDDTPQTTPKSEAAKPRTSSGTPSSVRGRGRPPSAKKSRQSRSSGVRNEISLEEADSSKNPLVPVANMGNADELLGDNKVDDSTGAKSNSKADSSDKSPAKNRENATGAPEQQDQELDEGEGEEQEVKAILNFRASESEKGAIELLVHWADEAADEATWEPEEEIQKGAAETVYEYWKAKGGRGRALFQDLQLPEEYRVFQILRHEKKQRGGFHLEVQWVGYSDSPVDTTWEPEAKLKTSARAPLDEYWESVGGRDNFLAKRGRSKK